MKREKHAPHIIAVTAFVVFIVLGLSSATTQQGNMYPEWFVKSEDGLWTYNNARGTIYEYHGDSDNFVIPDEIDGIKITTIDGHLRFTWEQESERRGAITENLSSITIPDGITSITGKAFSGNPLTEVIVLGQLNYVTEESLSSLTGYFLLNGMQPGTYTKNNNTWFLNGIELPIKPAVLRFDFLGPLGVRLVSINGADPDTIRKRGYIPAGELFDIQLRWHQSTTVATDVMSGFTGRSERPSVQLISSAEATLREQIFLPGMSYIARARQVGNQIHFEIIMDGEMLE